MIEGDDVMHELLLPVAPEEAFEMFVDPVRLVRWIRLSADLDPRPGGRFRFEVSPGQYCEGERSRRAPALAVDVLTETTIRRTRAEVAAYAADPDNAPAWYENIESVRWKTAPPLHTGSEIEFAARFLGRRLAYTYRVIEFVPNERLVMSTSERPFPMETTYTWSALGETSTRMTLRNRGGGHGLMRVLGPLEALAVRRANRKDLARLRSLLERSE